MSDSNKPVAVVTGAARGIGAAIATRLAADGFQIVAVDLDPTATAQIATRLGGIAAAMDVTDKSAAEKLSATLPRVDALVNNAGIFPPSPISDVTLEQFRKVLDVNVVGPLNMIQALLPQLTRATNAAVVNIASTAAKVVTPGTAAYAPSKAALVSLTRLCAVELAERRIRVNAVAPGGVLTEATASVSADPEREARFNALIPAGRRALPDDIADAVPFFLGPDARYVTGQVLYVDGGLSEGTINYLRAAQSAH